MTTTQPRARRSGSTRKYLTVTAERILAEHYPGQIPATVIERALKRMAAADARRERADARREGRPA